jgi:cytochrome c-type biogenesis protein CcmH
LTIFLGMAGALVLLAVGLVTWPLWRGGVNRWAAVLTGLSVTALGIVLYLHWSNFDWHKAEAHMELAPGGAPNVDLMLSKLEHRLALQPNDFQGWLMLGRSDLALNRIDGAVNAYTKAFELSGEQSAQAAAGLGEALTSKQGGQVTPEADRLFERALVLAPENPQALFFGAFAAASRGDKATARARWGKLKSQNPPPQILALIDAQLAALDSPAQGTAPVSSPSAKIHLMLAPAWRQRITPDLPLFVFARLAGEKSGPPLAVKRLTAQAIGTHLELTSQDAMLAGSGFAAGARLEITARISASGQPTPKPGDLYGSVRYTLGQDGEVALTIDREVGP